MTDPIDLDRMDALHAAATPGRADAFLTLEDGVARVHVDGCPHTRYAQCDADSDLADAQYDAALRNAYPALAAELRAARARLATLEPLVAAIVQAATTPPPGFESEHEDGKLWLGEDLQAAVEALVRAESGTP